MLPPHPHQVKAFSPSPRGGGRVRAISDGAQATKAPHPNPLPEGRGHVKLCPLRQRSRGERAPVKLGALSDAVAGGGNRGYACDHMLWSLAFDAHRELLRSPYPPCVGRGGRRPGRGPDDRRRSCHNLSDVRRCRCIRCRQGWRRRMPGGCGWMAWWHSPSICLSARSRPGDAGACGGFRL